MKKILLLLMFIIYSSSFIYAVETKTQTNTNTYANITEKISILEEQIKNVSNITDLNNQNNKEFLNSSIDDQNKIIDNIKWHIDCLLIIIGIIAGLLGFFIYRENKKSRDDMNDAKKDYEKAQVFYEKAVESLDNCSNMINNRIKYFDVACEKKLEEFDEKGQKKLEDLEVLYKAKSEELTELYKTKVNELTIEFEKLYKTKVNELTIEFEKLYETTENKIKDISEAVKKELNDKQEISSLLLEMNTEIGKENFTNVLSVSEKIIKLDEDNEWGYYGKATALLNISNNEEQKLNNALENIEKAIKINDNSELFKVTKAVICGRLGKIQESLDIYMSLKDKNMFVLINMIEMKIIMNRIQEAKNDLLILFPKIKNNAEYQINYNILKTEIMCIEDKNIEEIKIFVKENIFKRYKNKKLYWSFYEICSSSYLESSQKNKLDEIVEYIKQNIEVIS